MATKRDRDDAPKKRCDAKCSLCYKNKKKTNAELYCVQCQDFLCPPCSDEHDANHNKLEVSADMIFEKCGEHEKETITMYCERDDKLLCKMCQMLDHRSCNNGQPINESLRALSANPEIKAVPANLKSALTNIKKSFHALDKHKKGCQKKESSYLKDLEKKAKALISRIKELKEKDKNVIEDTHKKIRLRAEELSEECAKIQEELNQRIDKTKKSTGCNANMFVLKNKGLQIIQQIIQAADTLSNESNSLIKGCQSNVTTNMAIHEHLNCTSYLMKPSLARIRSINVRMSDDSCGINGCCVLGDGRLVIIDTVLKKLKLIDPLNSTVIKQWDTMERPLDVCCTGDKNFAVSFSSVIREYNADQTETKTINLGHAIQKMTWQSDLLYVSNNQTLYVYNFQTRILLRTIEQDAEGGNLFFSSIQGIALNLKGDRVYVVDENGLVCVNEEGQLIFRLTQDALKLKGAEGVVTDERGHVFVSGLGSSNVVEVTEQGDVVGEILSLKDGVERPHCLGYNENHRQLYVGGDSNTLLVLSS